MGLAMAAAPARKKTRMMSCGGRRKPGAPGAQLQLRCCSSVCLMDWMLRAAADLCELHQACTSGNGSA